MHPRLGPQASADRLTAYPTGLLWRVPPEQQVRNPKGGARLLAEARSGRRVRRGLEVSQGGAARRGRRRATPAYQRPLTLQPGTYTRTTIGP